jgi:pentatricopeptide repeat protein
LLVSYCFCSLQRNRSRFGRSKFDTPFLKDRSTDLSKTFVAPSPDATNLPPNTTYVYPHFPTLNPSLFSKPRISGPLLLSKHHAHHPSSMLINKSGISLGSWQPKKVAAAKDASRRSSFNAVQTTSSEQVIATLWFVLFTAITGENRQAGALDTAFQVLVNIRNNGLQPEEEIFPCFMFACGSCGVPERAIDVLREMTNSGFAPDPNTYAALLQVFTMNGDHKGAEALANLKGGVTNSSSPVTGGALVNNLKKELSRPHKTSTSISSHTGSNGSPPPTFYQHPFNPNDPSSPCSSPQPLKITEIKEHERINMFKLQFEMIFAGLEVNTEEQCPECNKRIEDQSVAHITLHAGTARMVLRCR